MSKIKDFIHLVRRILLEKIQEYYEMFLMGDEVRNLKEIGDDKIIPFKQIESNNELDDGLITAKYEVSVGKDDFPCIGGQGYFIRSQDNRPQRIFIRKIIGLEWRMSRNKDHGMVVEVVCKAEIPKEPSPEDYTKPFSIICGGKGSKNSSITL
jgi:hypothetical protein